jgi:hypothetical protein
VIGFAGEQRSGFEVADECFRAGEFAVQIFQKISALLGVGFFGRKADIGLDVARNGSELFVGGNLFFGTLTIAEDGLGFFLVVPEIGIRYAGFESFQALAVLRGVKESSARG